MIFLVSMAASLLVGTVLQGAHSKGELSQPAGPRGSSLLPRKALLHSAVMLGSYIPTGEIIP